MKKIKYVFLAVVLLTLSFLSSLSSSEESLQAKQVHIFYTSNILGQIEPMKDENGNPVGGVVRLGYIISLKRKELGNFLLLDSGNAIGPNSYLRFSGGLDQIKIMNRVGYTAMALGEMEFMYGPEALKKCIKKANFPLLSANVIYKDTGKYFTNPYFIYNTSDGLRVGITALTDPDIPLSVYGFSNLEIDYPSSCLPNIIYTLKEEKGCELVIVLSNLGKEQDKQLAESISNIDTIIGGNIRIISPSKVYQLIPQDINKGVCRFYSTPLATSVGKISLEVEKHNNITRLTDVNCKSFYLDEKSYPQDMIEKQVPELKKFVEKDIIERYRPKEEMVIGEVKEDETIKLADLVLLLMQKQINAEFALCDRGLFGWFLKDVKLQGKIKECDIDNGIPYPDDLVLVKMTGNQILDIIDYHKEQVGTTKELIFSPGFDPESQKINGRDIDGDEEYIVAVNNYLADQGAGYYMFEDAKLIKDTNIKIRDLVLNYIKEKSIKGQKISLYELKQWAERMHWKYKLSLSSTELDTFSKSKNADSYYDIDNFSSSKYYQWKIEPVFKLKGCSKKQSFDFTLTSEYGKRKYFPEDEDPYEEEVEDSVDADLDYRKSIGKDFYGTIFLELDDLEITPEEEDYRQGSLSTNLGIGYEFSSDFDLSLGLSAHNKLFIPGEDYGLYLNAEYQKDFDNLSFDIKSYIFYILRSGQVCSYTGVTSKVGDYTVKIESKIDAPLTENIDLYIEPFIYYDSGVGDWAWSLSTSLSIILSQGLLP